jgi:hypothetical protein
VFGPTGDDEELEGVEVGLYEDFGRLRSTVAQFLEPDGWGTGFPVLMSHPDSDGQWSPQVAAAELSRLPAQPLPFGWQSEVAREFGIEPVSLSDCFFDVDGEPLLGRLIELARTAVEASAPIWFQEPGRETQGTTVGENLGADLALGAKLAEAQQQQLRANSATSPSSNWPH